MRNSLLFVMLIGLVSCNSNMVFTEFHAMDDGKWGLDEPVFFQIMEMDSTQTYNVFINVRNDDSFAYNNLYLITEFEDPDGNTQKDTLEYRMAEPSGKWLGKGIGGIKENKLWFKEKVVFPNSGVYKVSIAHAMRKNGNVDGIQKLSGIIDVGLEIEKSTN